MKLIVSNSLEIDLHNLTKSDTYFNLKNITILYVLAKNHDSDSNKVYKSWLMGHRGTRRTSKLLEQSKIPSENDKNEETVDNTAKQISSVLGIIEKKKKKQVLYAVDIT